MIKRENKEDPFSHLSESQKERIALFRERMIAYDKFRIHAHDSMTPMEKRLDKISAFIKKLADSKNRTDEENELMVFISGIYTELIAPAVKKLDKAVSDYQDQGVRLNDKIVQSLEAIEKDSSQFEKLFDENEKELAVSAGFAKPVNIAFNEIDRLSTIAEKAMEINSARRSIPEKD